MRGLATLLSATAARLDHPFTIGRKASIHNPATVARFEGHAKLFFYQSKNLRPSADADHSAPRIILVREPHTVIDQLAVGQIREDAILLSPVG